MRTTRMTEGLKGLDLGPGGRNWGVVRLYAIEGPSPARAKLAWFIDEDEAWDAFEADEIPGGTHLMAHDFEWQDSDLIEKKGGTR